MRSTTLLSLTSVLLLAACSANGTSISAENKNPLVAAQYGDELADTMANLIIQNDPIVQDAAMKEVIDAEIARGKGISEEARMLHSKGLGGALIPINQEVEGLLLFTDGKLHFHSTFFTDPGPNLHVFMTEAVDPRDVSFPDKTAVDLGEIQSAYGAQTYAVKAKNASALRTVVLWDLTLNRLYSFAQLAKGL